MFRPDSEPLLPNWRWLPVGYHGRAVDRGRSGTGVRRPSGQSRPPGAEEPGFGPSRRLDIELELGFVVGVPSALGEPVPPDAFGDYVFGVVLVNDWSARDLQGWEYQPLGPFLGKSFATSVSAWVTPLTLLESARVDAPPQEPPALAHLDGGRDWALDIALEVELNGSVISRGNAAGLYWTMPQQLAHATSNGASIRTGDLMASGTISGAERGSEGSLIELTRNGTEPIRLADGSERTFLDDGDEVVLRGRAANGIELGEARGRIEPAPDSPPVEKGVRHPPPALDGGFGAVAPDEPEHALPRVLGRVGELVLAPVEEAVRRALVDHDLVLDTGVLKAPSRTGRCAPR